MISSLSTRLSLSLAFALLCFAGCASLDVDSVTITPLETDPALDSRYALARLCERRQQTEKAREIYKDILATRPQDQTALYRLGVICAKEGSYDQAQQYFDKAVAQDGQNVELINDMGYCFFLQDKLSEAEECFRRSLELNRTYKPAWTNLGLVLGQQGKFEASRAAFEKSANTPAEVHCCMAYVYLQLFQLESAQAEYRAALTLDPELRIAAQGLLDISRHIPGQTPVVVAATYGAESRQNKEPENQEESPKEMMSPLLQTSSLSNPTMIGNPIEHPATQQGEVNKK